MSILQCPSCAADVPAGSRFCGACGQPQPVAAASQASTRADLNRRPLQLAADRVQRLVSSDTIPVGGFTPGAILLDRYRVIGLLGRGGMGEVYRADDLKLGQAVALKFLPKALASDPVRRERFFAEVRITRQVSHPNICRVYDIAEVDGLHFLSMEYIDGEDLASLLKRIGYLPNEKALDIARQLLAGLAAAHDRGVLHRDLKPANVMIDGRGRVRITDFGLAIAADDEGQAGDTSGTPAYMAPEQLAGKGATVRSDIYALGLILYEIYTGQRAFAAPTIAELRDQKEGRTPAAPSEIRPSVDPAIERLIMRCIDRDPRARPASVAQLSAALPGGDPLAAAIAAGETPSPELLIAAGPKDGLHPAVAVALLTIVILGCLAAAVMHDRVGLVQRAILTKSPEALAERARDFLKKAGYPEEPGDVASGFYSDDNVLQYIQSPAAGPGRRNNPAGVGAVGFFYRRSPTALVGVGPFAGVGPTDPPVQFPGEVAVWLDGEGRLMNFEAVPPRDEPASTSTSAPDWTVLFAEAGLPLAAWTTAEPRLNPPVYANTRAAWQGSLAGEPEVPLRVEAAGYNGKAVNFEIIGPWTPATPSGSLRSGASQGLDAFGVPAFVLVLCGLVGSALFFARRNLRLGRGDRRGATRLMLFVFASWTVAWLGIEHHVAGTGEALLFAAYAGTFLPVVGVLWVLYIAVEPFVRRRWPGILVSWTRVLGGDWRDPRLGRDVLIGCAAGVCGACIRLLAILGPSWSSDVPPPVMTGDWNMLDSTASFVGAVFGQFSSSIVVTLGSLVALFLLRVVLRRDWAAASVYVLLGALASLPPTLAPSAALVLLALVSGVLSLFVLMRVGLVASTLAGFLATFFLTSPLTAHTSAWYSGVSDAIILLAVAMSLYGFKISLGGRPILSTLAADD